MKDAEHSTGAVIAALSGLGELKVWSVLVTLFGDLAPAGGGELPGPLLSALCAKLGLRPEALRVALYRLRRDDWIETRRAGRIGLHRLSAHARAETDAVWDRVYGLAPTPACWWVALTPPDAHPPAEGAVMLGPGSWVVPQKPEAADVISLPPGDAPLPGWASAALLPSDQRAAYRALTDCLKSHAIPAGTDPLDRAALRLIVLHHWRRLVLRHPSGLAALLGPEWEGAACRAEVMRWLAALPRQDVGTLAT